MAPVRRCSPGGRRGGRKCQCVNEEVREVGRRFSDVSRALALILDLIGGILYGILRFMAARLGLEGVDKLCRRFRV